MEQLLSQIKQNTKIDIFPHLDGWKWKYKGIELDYCCESVELAAFGWFCWAEGSQREDVIEEMKFVEPLLNL